MNNNRKNCSRLINIIANKDELVPLIVDVCKHMTSVAPRHHVELMLGTAAAESSLIYRVQHNEGPARGLWQMEPGMTGAMDTFVNWLYYRPKRFRKLAGLWLHVEEPPLYWEPTESDLAYHLEHNDPFACAMAREKYRRDAMLIPETVREQAAYWLRAYNAGGKGTTAHYLDQWYACGCPELLQAYYGGD